MSVVSPLTGYASVTRLSVIQTDTLIRNWRSTFQVDIEHELKGHESITLYRCNETGLIFFSPNDVCGSAKFYEQLERYDWYYMPLKWEHTAAIKDLSNCYSTLEVGCGRGDYVEYLRKEYKIDVQGLELNAKAVAYGQSKGLPIYQTDLHCLAKQQPNFFDAVCAFQVLEHVAHPREFLEDMITLLKPGGKLILAVPNNNSFIQFDQNDLFNQPPHHMSHWCEQSLFSLTHLFPIRVHRFEFEPLAQYHTDWSTSVQITRYLKTRLLQSVAFKLSSFLFKPVLEKFSFVRSKITGHTIYACFEKVND